MIGRPVYIQQLRDYRDMKIIKVVTGIRRCGKSTLLELFKEELLGTGILPSQMISLNFEDYSLRHLRNPGALHEYIVSKLVPAKMNYVFLDEVQHVENYSEVLDSLFIRDNVDLYVTGSNAYLLSSEIATYISGRYIEIRMLPLSFKEYVSAVPSGTGLSGIYGRYLQTGGFPYGLELKEHNVREYLENIYNTVILKDVISRNRIADPMMLESVVRFIFDNIGNTTSIKNISSTMTSGGRKIENKTVEKYLNALIESFVIYKAERFDIKGKEYLKTLQKYYVVDPGLRAAILGGRSFDSGHILENVIYLELLRRGFKVYVGKIGNTEVDFVARNARGLEYYQVSATVRGEDTLQRELTPLKAIKDNYPKTILTLDDDPDADYDGVRRVNALSWLLESESSS